MRILIHIKKLDVESTLTFILNDIFGLRSRTEIKILCSEQSTPPSVLEQEIIKYPYSDSSFLCRLQHFLAVHDIIIDFKNYTLQRFFKKTINSFKPDIIITHFGDESLIFLQNVKVNIPIVAMFHGYDASAWLHVKKYVKTYRNLVAKSNLTLVSCSENMKIRMMKAGIPMAKSEVLYYGIDTRFFERKKRTPNETPVYLQVSSFHKKKGHFYTLYAFRRFLDLYPHERFKLVLAGDGKLRDSIIRLAMELKLENYVSFPGWVNRQETKSLLESANYFVHHSISDEFGNMEGIPNAIIEAMAMELPVVSTFHSGIPELVTNFRNGILVSEKNTEDFAAAIKSIRSYSYLPENRKKIEMKFDINTRIDKLYALIQKLADEKR